MKVVLALGGNALSRPDQKGTYQEEVANVRFVCRQLAEIIADGHQVVLTHGNGPQVGSLAIQEASVRDVPAKPLHVLDAMTQGEIGYLIQRELGNELREAKLSIPVASVVTQVLVDVDDPAFKTPSKPIGPFYDEATARAISIEKGYMMKEVNPKSKRGYRRVVPSPDPKSIVEEKIIAIMLRAGYVVIAGGGGGIPVVRSSDGRYEGIDAVIDKDLCAEKIAESVGADTLMILTNVDKVNLDNGTERQRSLDSMSSEAAKQFLSAGQFPQGTMGPKVLACVRFVDWGGKQGIIASLEHALDAMAGKAGTRITLN